MRLRLTLKCPEQGWVDLPTDYNYLIQAAIYRNISRALANFLHEKGFLLGKRRFKMFTFSRLEGRCKLDRDNKRFIFEGDLTLHISSPIERFVQDLATTIVKRGFIILGEKRLKVADLAFPAKPTFKNCGLRIRMLSPLTVYSTLMTSDGKKKTYYFSPYEKEFSALVDFNVKKKHFLLSGKNIKSNIKIKPLGVKEVVTLYKGTVIKGWMGHFLLSGPKSLIMTAYEVGLGAKNSQGFGMFEVV
ncbi:MAG: CRISPR-associated endoribonuclease Cas6 [Nitrososphaerota archaeon]|nr:CRISPR-associated endoribonuclease Cas6 [Candidatus Bathyarchaeota archaeon]MDW8022874.1 CRISPR-associated endoribonuclease Cas6 [Nitrososphaerota archaeon]